MKNPVLVLLLALFGLSFKIYAQEESLPLEKHFGPTMSEFTFSVPTDFDHAKCIDLYTKKVKEVRYISFYCQNVFNSDHFSKVTNQLEPGKTYQVKIFPIVAKTTVEDCIAFIKKQKGLLVGGPGMILIQDFEKDQFPVGKYTISVDAKHMLWKEGDCVKIPYIYRFSSSGWWIDMHCFDDIYGTEGNDCLLCVIPQ
jgi:hypothetical protein